MSSAPRLGPWELQHLVGRGAMGEVWAARHGTQDVPVAVKVLTAATALDVAHQEAFRTEVRAVAALDHPGIVALFDHGVVAADVVGVPVGCPYLVMELATGGSIDPLCGKAPWREVCEVLLGLLDALAHAHARGVIHRDVKPANVLLAAPHDHRPGLKLTDFGIASILGGQERGMQTNTIAGTPRYMAPEQFSGDLRESGPWTDLYAVGIVAWELVTGRAPFTIKGRENLFRAHTQGMLPPLSPSRPVPEGLEDWLRVLLAKQPHHRYQRAADAAWALRQLPEVVDEGGGVTQSTSTRTAQPTLTLDPSTWDVETQLTEATELTGEPRVDETVETMDPSTMRDVTASRVPGRVPPHPLTWRRHDEARPPELLGVGLGLYGVRSIPLVGRDFERDTLWQALSSARARSEPRCVVLRGSSGVGKSRLAGWITERAHELGAATPVVAMHGSLGGPTDGLVPMLVRHLGCQGLVGVALDARLELLADHRRVVPDDVEALAELFDPGRGQVRFEQDRQRWAVVLRALVHVAVERPVVVWLDDVQWGPEALQFAGFVLDRHPQAALLLILTAQEEALSERREAAALLQTLAARDKVIQLSLQPLGDEQRLELVRSLLGLSGLVASQVARRSGGNPLFAVQLVGDWVQRGLLAPTAKGFELRRGARLELPDDLHAIWAARVTRVVEELGEHTRSALELAAALGQDVDIAEWRAVCAAAGVPIASRMLGHLAQRGMAFVGDTAWSFAHGMLRESLARLARESGRWARWNSLCADLLAAREGRGVPERRGRHRLLAGEPEAAIDDLLEGARRRLSAGQPREAEGVLVLWEDALREARVGQRDVRRAQGLLLRSRLAQALGDTAGARDLGRRVQRLAQRNRWPLVHAEACEQLSALASNRGDMFSALELQEQARDGYEELGQQRRAARATRSLGRLSVLAGDLDRADELLEEAFTRLTDLGDAEEAATCVNLQGDVARLRRDWDLAIRRFEEALSLHSQLGARSEVERCMHGVAEIKRLRGELDDAERRYEVCLEMQETLGQDTSITELNLGLCAIARSDWGAAWDRLAPVRERWEREGRGGYLGCLYTDLLPVAAGLGDWDTWDSLLPQAVSSLDLSAFVDVDIAWPAQLAGELAAAAGHLERAREAYAIALSQWEALDDADMVEQVHAAVQALR